MIDLTATSDQEGVLIEQGRYNPSRRTHRLRGSLWESPKRASSPRAQATRAPQGGRVLRDVVKAQSSTLPPVVDAGVREIQEVFGSSVSCTR